MAFYLLKFPLEHLIELFTKQKPGYVSLIVDVNITRVRAILPVMPYGGLLAINGRTILQQNSRCSSFVLKYFTDFFCKMKTS